MFGTKLSKKHVMGLGGEDFNVLNLRMMIYADNRKLSIGYVPAESSVSEVNRGYAMNHWSCASGVWYGNRSSVNMHMIYEILFACQ
jgi:hypothetical protein